MLWGSVETDFFNLRAEEGKPEVREGGGINNTTYILKATDKCIFYAS